MNEYVEKLVADLRQRFSIEAAGMTTGEWVSQNTQFRAQPFSFDGYNFQRTIIDDLHPNLDVIKISQVGLTEIQMRKACAMLVRNNGLVGIFSMPDEKLSRKFSQTRLKPFIDENKVFSSRSDGVRSVDTLQIGSSFLHIVNATESSATSISADFVFNDEVDLSDQRILALFASRLQNSTWKVKQRFSTPSWSGFGIDSTYSVSDQREYFCRCGSCGRQQVPLYDERNVRIPGLSSDIPLYEITDEMLEGLDLQAAYVACEKCNAELDLNSPDREWVATFPSRTNGRGYRVRPFSSPRITIPYILNSMLSYRRQDFIRGWHNTVIGEAFTDSQARLEEGQIKACMTGELVPVISSKEPVFVGIDVGDICHIVLGTTKGVFSFIVVKAREVVSKVVEILAQYNVVAGMVDRHPYTPTAEEIRDVSGGKIMPCEYRGDAELRPIKDPSETVTHWQCNRTKAIDNVVKIVRVKGIAFAGYGTHARVLIEHLRDMVREETAEKAASWIKLTGNDHYFHAIVFMRLSMKLNDTLDLLVNSDTRSTLLVSQLAMPRPSGLLRTRN